MEQLKEKDGDDEDAVGSIIGQFGVGFYSSFIVADKVEVLSKRDGHDGVSWVSDGSGEFDVADATNLSFKRGTQIKLKLRAESREFSQEVELDKTI